MTKSNQQGGMFLGLILGLVLGLAAALGVAVYVGKVPIPLINKSATRSASQDAAEAERNRNWDPNALLRGSRQGEPPAASASPGEPLIPEPEPAATPEPDAAEDAQAPVLARPIPPPAEVQSSTPAAATRPPAADPLGELVAARTAPAAPADPFAYFVQAGAFRNLTDADAQRARLSLLGVEARISEREQAGRTVYRVRVGPFQNQDAAERVKQRLVNSSFDAALVRVQR